MILGFLELIGYITVSFVLPMIFMYCFDSAFRGTVNVFLSNIFCILTFKRIKNVKYYTNNSTYIYGMSYSEIKILKNILESYEIRYLILSKRSYFDREKEKYYIPILLSHNSYNLLKLTNPDLILEI